MSTFGELIKYIQDNYVKKETADKEIQKLKTELAPVEQEVKSLKENAPAVVPANGPATAEEEPGITAPSRSNLDQLVIDLKTITINDNDKKMFVTEKFNKFIENIGDDNIRTNLLKAYIIFNKLLGYQPTIIAPTIIASTKPPAEASTKPPAEVSTKPPTEASTKPPAEASTPEKIEGQQNVIGAKGISMLSSGVESTVRAKEDDEVSKIAVDKKSKYKKKLHEYISKIDKLLKSPKNNQIEQLSIISEIKENLDTENANIQLNTPVIEPNSQLFGDSHNKISEMDNLLKSLPTADAENQSSIISEIKNKLEEISNSQLLVEEISNSQLLGGSKTKKNKKYITRKTQKR